MLSKPRATADNVILTNFISRLFARSRAVDHGAVEELLQRGYRCQQAGEREVAERIYLDALKIDACHADANYLLGALLGESSRFTEAAALLDRALASKPDFAAAHAARGNVFLMLGAQQAAVASYEQALRLDPDNAAAHFNLGLIWQTTGAREQALIRFERAHALAPEIPDLLKNLTLSYLETERYEDAQAVLQGVLAQTPQRAEALKWEHR